MLKGRVLASAIALLSGLGGPFARAGEPDAAGAEFFEKQIRPILAERCQKCHAGDAPKGGLNLLSRAGLMQGGDSGPSAVEGKPEESPLVHAVRYVDEPRMPPKKRLAEPEIEAISRWVQMGLPWPESAEVAAPEAPTTPAPAFAINEAQRAFWSLRPVTDPAPPAVKDGDADSTPVDRFLRAKLEQEGFRPAPPADRRTLIRRATFDLIGLPPTPEEVDAFLADESPDAFAKVVDRLLASPRYGERWGRHWLDVVRYADTAGETADYPVPDARRYRDYVIDAFNRDLPYNEFLREQIAGDLLAAEGPRERYEARLVATGYLAIARRFGFDPQNYHHLTIDDTIDALGKSILGLSIACARCHDHKFDPIAQADYYALYGILDSTRYPFPGSEEVKVPRDFVPILPPAEVEAALAPHRASLAPIDSEIAALDARNAGLDAQIAAATAQVPMTDRGILDALRKRKAELAASRAEAGQRRDALAAQAPPIELAYAVAEGTPHDAKIQRRGDPRTLGPEVPRRFPLILGGQSLPTGTPGSGRRQLADWLADPANPLTARVMVNRLWQHHFGRGIVATPSDFGKRGRAPSHPELLDYLASRFVASGWSIKAMHRTLMLTDAYRMSGAGDPRLAEADPENAWLGRFPRRRLEAEPIRDAMLAVSGDLDPSPPGPHPFPPQAAWGFTQHQPFQAVYETRHRSVYLMSQRQRRHPYLALFDGADPNVSTDHRATTTVPTQALFFLNNPLVHDQSAKFAARLLREAPADDARRLDLAHRLALGRPATPEEVSAAAEYLRDARADLQSAGLPADALPAAAWASYARVLFGSNEFLFVD